MKKRILTMLLVIIILTPIIGYGYARDVFKNREEYKEKFIRFHVIANSDSPEDQQLKLRVRDKILEEMGKKFEHSNSIDETKEIVKENLDRIEYIAKKEIKENGKDYDVEASIGLSDFPTKRYGDYTLPAGKYEAVKVIIGEGNGQNWWCVMFPPLCFIDTNNGLTGHKSEKALKKVLTQEEYNMILTSRQEEKPMKLKFKIVELFEKNKNVLLGEKNNH